MQRRILVLEDEPIVRRDLCSSLEQGLGNIEAVGVGDYERFKLISKQYQPDVALIDIRIGDKDDGLIIAKSLSELAHRPKIIFVTSHSDESYLEKMMECDPDTIITKPFTQNQIQVAVRKALENKKRGTTSQSPREVQSFKSAHFAPTKDVQALSHQMAFYERMIDRIALVSITDRTGRIVHANPKFCEVSGYTREELIGKDHRLINSGQHDREFWADMYRHVSTGAIWTNTVCNRRKDGSFYYVKSYIAGFEDQNGRLQSYFSIRFDVSNDKERQEYLKLKEDYLKHLMNEEFVYTYLSGISHHINNIMATTPARLSSLKSCLDKNDTDGVLTNINRIDKTCNRMVEFLANLNRMTHNVTHLDVPRRIVKIQDLMEGAKAIAKTSLPQLKDRLEFHLYDIGDATVLANQADLTKAILHLLRNTIEHNEALESIRVKLQARLLDDKVLIEVEDNGRGFNDEELSAAAFPFFTSKEAVYNVGIGLSEVRRIMRENYGFLVISNQNSGAKVTLELPLNENPASKTMDAGKSEPI